MALFSDTLLDEIRNRGETVNGSLLVSLLMRVDPQTRSLRDLLEEWYRQVPESGRKAFFSRLTSVKNEEFFQGFAELTLHRLLSREGLEYRQFPEGPQKPFFMLASPQDENECHLYVSSFIPEGHSAYARRAYKNFIEELNKIKQRYRFAVYLRRWLPPDFDPSVVRRALENWFHRLDSDPHGGMYAEYRDGGVHVEFSILSKLSKQQDHLVGFYLTPLESTEILDKFREQIDGALSRYRRVGDRRRPLVVALFNNDEWKLPPNSLYDFFYGKPRLSFEWQSLEGRHERIRDFSHIFAQAIFNTGQGEDLAAVLLVERSWRDSGVELKVRCLHNPWCRFPLPEGFLAERTSLRPIAGTTPEQMIVRWSQPEGATILLS